MSRRLLAPFEPNLITKLLDPPKRIKTISDLLVPFEPGMEGRFIPYEIFEGNPVDIRRSVVDNHSSQ